MTNKEQVYTALRGEGLSLALVCGIMANIQRESNYNPKAKGDSGTSFGLCQWHKGRWERLSDFCFDRALSETTIASQVKFLVWEFSRYYSNHWDSMRKEPDTAEGAYNVAYTMCVKYEVPAQKETKGKQRGNIAKELFAEFTVAEEPEGYTRYIIQKGDTLMRLAHSFGTTIERLLELNPSVTNPDKIKAGDVLIVEETAGETPEATAKGDVVSSLRAAIKIIEDVIDWLDT